MLSLLSMMFLAAIIGALFVAPLLDQFPGKDLDIPENEDLHWKLYLLEKEGKGPPL